MTKADLVARVAEETGLTKKETAAVVAELLAAIRDAFREGNRIEIRGFGTFKVEKRKPRVARNPRTGDTVQIPERVTPVFKPSRSLKRLVDQR